MRFMKKHKLTTFIIIIYIAIIIVLYFLYKIFMGSNGLPVYGDRLDGIENVPITNEQKTKLVNDLKANSDVIKVSEPHLSGRTYNVVIYVTDVDKVDNAKKLADIVTKNLDDKQNEYYDVQVFIAKKQACTLEATGVVDEDGNFTSDVKVKFKDDLASDKNVLGFGISSSKTKDYNAKNNMDIKTDGEFVVYGYTKDKGGESTCSIKIVRNSAKTKGVQTTTINSSTGSSFPIIGYKKKGSKSYVWTKDR